MAPATPVTSAAPAASAYVAGSAPGLGAGEAPRRRLTQADVAGIVRAEAAERGTAQAGTTRPVIRTAPKPSAARPRSCARPWASHLGEGATMSTVSSSTTPPR